MNIVTSDGEFQAYFARAVGRSEGPAVLVLPEAYGVNLGMREICDEFAQLGLHAVCPDILWRVERGAALEDKTSADRDRAGRNASAFDLMKGLDDVVTAVASLRVSPGVDGRVAILGFGLGGLLSFLAAARCHPDAAVAYYGTGIEGHLDEAARMVTPLLLQLGDEDDTFPAHARIAIVAALELLPRVEVEIHPKAGHAFARRHSSRFDPVAEERAARYTAEFLHAHMA